MTTFELGLLGLLAHSNTNPVLMGISISKSQYRLDVFRVNHRLLSIASLQDIFTSSSGKIGREHRATYFGLQQPQAHLISLS